MEISDNLLTKEIELFAKCLSESARDGHFYKTFSDRLFTLDYLKQISANQVIPAYGSQRGVLFVFRENGECVCFALVCSSIFPQADAELLFFLVPKTHRKRGYGKKAMHLILAELQGKTLLARCMPKSTFMVELLTKVGFIRIDIGSSTNINLIHKNG